MRLQEMPETDDYHHRLTLVGGGAVDIVVACHGWHKVLGDGDWRAYAMGAIQQCKIQGQSLTILLADNKRMHDLNRRFGKEDKPTNVLAFPATASQQNHAGDIYLGDVALGYEAVVAGAGDRGVPMFHHAMHLIVHGVLHLLGCDHKDDEEAQRMEALESKIMLAIGLADPHADAIKKVAGHG